MPAPRFLRGRVGQSLRGPAFRPLRLGASFSLVGITKDNAGVALGSCTVDLFLKSGNIYVGSTVSDGSGNFVFTTSTNSVHFVRTYNSLGTLVGSSGDLIPV